MKIVGVASRHSIRGTVSPYCLFINASHVHVFLSLIPINTSQDGFLHCIDFYEIGHLKRQEAKNVDNILIEQLL